MKSAELGLIPKSQSGSRYGRRDISLAAHRDGTRELREELGAREIYLSLIFQVNEKGGLDRGFDADTFLGEARHHHQQLSLLLCFRKKIQLLRYFGHLEDAGTFSVL